MQPEAGRSGSVNPVDPTALELLQVTGGQARPGGVSHSRTGTVKKKDTTGASLDGGVEELTEGGENDGQWTSLPNQSANHRTDFFDAEPHPCCRPVLPRGAITGFAMT
jgi:hypothetical protein